MSVFQLLLLIIISGITGSIAKLLTGFSRGGCIISVLVGFIGAALGNWIASVFDLPEFFTLDLAGRNFQFIWAIIGAVFFTTVLSVLTGKKN